MVSGSGSNQSNKSRSGSSTTFPGDFLRDFGATFGRGVSIEELLAGLPRSSSLFGGAPVGIFPTGNVAPQQALPYTPTAQRFAPQEWATRNNETNKVQNAQGDLQAQRDRQADQGRGPYQGGIYDQGPWGPGGAAQAYSAQGGAQGQAFPGARMQGQPGYQDVQAYYAQGGQGGAYPRGGYQQAPVSARQGAGTSGWPGTGNLGTFQEPSFIDPNAPVGPRFAASGSQVQGMNVPETLARQGFFNAPTDYRGAAELNIRQAPTINAAQADAAQMNLGGGDLNRFESSIFRSQFDPVAREINRQGTIDDRRLQAQLAQTGLASSGTGVGQLQAQGRERMQMIHDAATDAAQRAAAQRYGYQFSQEETNAQLMQQTRLANAGFNQQAQMQNADNILRGDTARADAYLKTIGLNEQSAQALRGDFLKAMDLAETDLQRMDNFQLQTLGVLLNNWLQQGSLAAQAGRETNQTSSGSGKSLSIGILS